LSLLTAESKAILLKNLMKRMQGLPVEPYEISFTDKTGKARVAEVKAKKIDYVGRSADLVIFRDITRRKENARRLKEYSEKMEALVNEKVKEVKESEEKYRELINGMNDTAWVIGLDGNFIDVNDAAVKVLGYSREELLRMGPPDIDNSLTKEQIRHLIRSMPADEIQVFETAHTTKDGKTIPVEISSSLVTYQGKQAILSIARGITERKKSEAKILASEKKYRRLFKELKRAEKQLLDERDRAQNYLDIADVMLIALDTECRITMINRKGCEILKCKAKEAVGKNWFDTFLPKKVKSDVKRRFKLVLTGKASFSEYHENPVLAKNGDIRLIGWHHTVLRNNDGRIIGALSSGEDITEWKQAQQALTDSEEMFRAITTYASDAIILLDKTDKVVYWNLAAEKIFGYAKEEAIGKKLNSLIVPPENHKHHLEMLNKLFKNKAQISEKRTEIKALRKDGTEFPIELSATVLSLKGVQYVLEIIRDVSERKKMENELKHERDMLESVTENVGAGLAIISKNYRILWANKLLKQLNGDCEGKLCYSTFNRLTEVCPDCGVKKVFENGVPIDIHEYIAKDDKGNTVWVELIVTPIKDEKGNVIAALELAVNITERKIMQNKLAEYSQKLEKIVEKRTEQLKQTQAKLVKSERLATIGELAAMVGHDLRNPLTGIMGAAYYLKTKHGTEVGVKGKEMLETIENAINYSNKIINDLLEYSRDLKLELTTTTPKAMLQNALSLLEVPEKIQIIDSTKDEPTVKADTEKIRNVFVHIIQNAIDATPEGGTLTIKSRKVKGKLEIAFKDTGAGMSEEALSKLKREVPLFTTKAKGMGFGLPICRRIVEAHSGKLSVKSTAGKGTTVTVTIPVNPKPVDEGEEKWIFSESMLSAITSAQRAR
jgi:PAS domain S-box-containing protein